MAGACQKPSVIKSYHFMIVDSMIRVGIIIKHY